MNDTQKSLVLQYLQQYKIGTILYMLYIIVVSKGV